MMNGGPPIGQKIHRSDYFVYVGSKFIMVETLDVVIVLKIMEDGRSGESLLVYYVVVKYP